MLASTEEESSSDLRQDYFNGHCQCKASDLPDLHKQSGAKSSLRYSHFGRESHAK